MASKIEFQNNWFDLRWPDRSSTKMLDLPLYMQGVDTNWCVPYSLWSIAQFYGLPVTVGQVIEACNASGTFGTHPDDYTKGVKDFGLKFQRLTFNYKNVSAAIRKKHPVVVCYMINDNESHFSTIIKARRGYRGIAHYLLNDTYFGRYEIPEPLLVYLKKLDGSSWARIVLPIKKAR